MIKNIKGTFYALNELRILLWRNRKDMSIIYDLISSKGNYDNVDGVNVPGSMYDWIKHLYMNDILIKADDIFIDEG